MRGRHPAGSSLGRVPRLALRYGRFLCMMSAGDVYAVGPLHGKWKIHSARRQIEVCKLPCRAIELSVHEHEIKSDDGEAILCNKTRSKA